MFSQGKQPTTGQKKTKSDISKAASQRSKMSKKKWTKGKVKEKLNNAVFLDKAHYDTIATGIPKMGKLVTISVLCDKFKINGSLARKVVTHFIEKGVLELVGDHNHQFSLYTVTAAAQAAVKAPVVDTKTSAKAQAAAKKK